MTADGEEVSKIVTLPINLINNAATVEIWYHAYIPKGHLLVDIEPLEATTSEDSPAKPEPQYVGYGDSLEYVGKDEPTEEEPRNKDGTLKSAYEDDESDVDNSEDSDE